MTASINRDGLPARQKATPLLRNLKLSKTFWVVLASLPLMLTSCQKSTMGQDSVSSIEDTISAVKPKVNIKVNKHYDDKGNVIGFDSTYTSYYSNIQRNTGRMDSLMQNFDTYFNRKHSDFFKDQFQSLFFTDSLLPIAIGTDFFHNDFFLKRYELNDSYFRDVMNRMDSIKNHFYKDRLREDGTRDL